MKHYDVKPARIFLMSNVATTVHWRLLAPTQGREWSRRSRTSCITCSITASKSPKQMSLRGSLTVEPSWSWTSVGSSRNSSRTGSGKTSTNRSRYGRTSVEDPARDWFRFLPHQSRLLLLSLSNQQRQLNSYGFQRITQGRDKVGSMSRIVSSPRMISPPWRS